jgi:hypothetical protein
VEFSILTRIIAMRDERLRIYINDHLALVTGEVELADRCLHSNHDGTLGHFLQRLSTELRAEQEILKQLLEQIGGSQSLIKQGVAWLAEKAGRFKLNDKLLEYSDLSRLIELETLFIAACERRAFWENLAVVRAGDTRLVNIDLTLRQQIARQQCDLLTTHRIEAAKRAI